MAVDNDRKLLYSFIADAKKELDTLYPIIDRMIDCPVAPSQERPKNDAPPAIIDSHRLVLEDHFEGPVLDSSKWNSQMIWGPDVLINAEEQYYSNALVGSGLPSPFSLDGQNLGITASYRPDLSDRMKGQKFLSGVITTSDSLIIRPGSYTEVCAKMPCGVTGFWGGIWLLNRYYQGHPEAVGANGKYETEIDWEFVEGPGGPFGGGPYDTSCAIPAYHYDAGFCKIDANGFGCDPSTGYNTPAASQQCDGTPLGTGFSPPRGFDPVCNRGNTCEGFHTYGWEWELDKLIYYMDGVPVRSICHESIVPQVPMYLIINQAVGGNFPGPADPNDYDSTMLIDYVRIYQR